VQTHNEVIILNRGSSMKIDTFIKRMAKLGIDIKLVGNYPWIYIDSINGVKVTEKFRGNHGFTLAFLPIRYNQEIEFTDISEIFKLIRMKIKECEKCGCNIVKGKCTNEHCVNSRWNHKKEIAYLQS